MLGLDTDTKSDPGRRERQQQARGATDQALTTFRRALANGQAQLIADTGDACRMRQELARNGH
jgi:hypothetical protein